MAVGAVAVDVDRVAGGTEAADLGGDVEGPLEAGLQRRLECDVGDRAAADAHQVVVMLGEVLGQLVVGVLGARDDAPHHLGILQGGEVAVGAALGEVGPPVQELRERLRRRCLGQRLDDAAPVGRVALFPLGEPRLGRPVQLALAHVGPEWPWA